VSNQREVFSKNLKSLIESRGIDQRILADYLGISEMSVSNWVNGLKYPRMGNIQKMADYFGVLKSDIIEDKNKEPLFTSRAYKYYPTAISAGLPIDVHAVTDEEVETIQIPDVLMGKHASSKEVFITKIYGDSMNKIMPDGSLIAVKPINLLDLKNGDVVVFSNDHEYSVKRYFKQGDRLIFRPESDNKEYYDQIYSVDDNITIHGKVVMHNVIHD